MPSLIEVFVNVRVNDLPETELEVEAEPVEEEEELASVLAEDEAVALEDEVLEAPEEMAESEEVPILIVQLERRPIMLRTRTNGCF